MKIIDTIKNNLGFKEWTLIQKESLNKYNQHSEVVLYAPTGSGKTLAFLIPLVELLEKNEKQGIQALILSPTRELALQIEQTFKSLKTNISITACYGGHSIKTEIQNLSASPTIVVGTPGRISDHLRRGNLSIDSVKYFVVDEFDKCLEIGFLNEIGHIYGEIKQLKKCFFSSATKLDEFPSFVNLKNPVYIDALNEMKQPDITYHLVQGSGEKLFLIRKMISQFRHEPSIIFCNFREDVDGLLTFFEEEHIAVTAYHGGMEQDERERSLIKFRNGSNPILICTDLGARGLDIPQIKHIIHFQLPDKEDAFIHRNGRTARMSEDGSVYLFEDQIEKASYQLPSLKKMKPDSSLDYYLPDWETVYFSAGKKDKVNKIDLVGFICQKGGVTKSDIGVISVLDNSSYVAIKADFLPDLLFELRKHKIKGQKVRIAISK